MAENKCPNCQIELNTGAQFCRRCGFKLSAPLVSPSATEATTRNLPNMPQMQDFRQTNNFGSQPFPSGQMPGSFAPPAGPQLAYTPMGGPPRRSNAPKIIVLGFIIFAAMAFCMVALLVGPFRAARNARITHPLAPISSTPFAVTATVKSFKLPADGQISLTSLSGKIEITPYDGDTFELQAVNGGGLPLIIDDVLDTTLTDKIFTAKVKGGRYISSGYELRVPRKFGELILSTISGNITMEGGEGKIKAHSTSGKISLEDVAGTVDLNTTSGDQTVSFKTAPSGDLNFNSISGNIRLNFNADPDLKVRFSSISGSVHSDYPLEKTSRPASITAEGVIGNGLHNLLAHTISGDFRLGH